MMVGRGRSGSSRSSANPPEDDASGMHVAVTCLDDGCTHAVADVELTNGAARSGRYRAVCGHLVTAAPMVAPEGAPCAACQSAATAQGPQGGARHRSQGGRARPA